MSEVSQKRDCRRVPLAHCDEHAEYRQQKRRSADSTDQAGEPQTRPAQRATDWQVSEEPGQLSDGPRRIDRIKPLSELVHAEPTLSGRKAQTLGRLLSVIVRSAKRPLNVHAFRV
jgi:hypothetical protein